MEVIDEQQEATLAKEVESRQKEIRKNAKGGDKTTSLQERLAAGEEITRKELKTIVKEYEKDERKQQKEPEVLSDVSFKIDSGAYKKDSLYWAEVRPIPLTREEIKGYQKADSTAAIERAKTEGDTVRQSKHEGFQPWDLFTGDNYKVSKHSNFRIYFPMAGFNTVEGFNIIYRVAFGTVFQDTNRTRFTIRPVARYAFSREKLSGYLNLSLRNDHYRLELNGGRYISQFNGDDPILPVVNTFTTLFLEKNLMKIYERDFIDLHYNRKINPFLAVSTTWSWSDRMELFNQSDYKLIDRKSIEGYTPNLPVNETLSDTGFPPTSGIGGILRDRRQALAQIPHLEWEQARGGPFVSHVLTGLP